MAAYLYTAAAVAYALDRVTKLLAERHLAGGSPVRLIPGVLQLTYTTNSGGAFGILQNQPVLFFAAACLISLGIVAASTRMTSTPISVGLGLILGGALGNLTDRLLRGPAASGRVVDFIDLGIWPVFNLADSAIVLGAAVVVLGSMRERS